MMETIRVTSPKKPRSTAAHDRRGRAGFSLLEVLVSVVILSFMGMLMYEGISQASEAKEETEISLDRLATVRVALSKMVRDLSMAFLSKHKDPAMGEKPRTLFKGARDKVAFTSLSHTRLVKNSKESDQCEISYWVKRSPRTRGDAIWRRESRRIDEKPLQGGPTMALIDEVVKFQLHYWDAGGVTTAGAPNTGGTCTDDCWKDKWDTTQLDGQPLRLPQRVRIRLTIKDEWGRDEKYETQAMLPIQDPLNF